MSSEEASKMAEQAQSCDQNEKNAKNDSELEEVNSRAELENTGQQYPHGIRLAVIIASLATSVFLVALVR